LSIELHHFCFKQEVVDKLNRTSDASYIPWNKGYWKGNVFSVSKYDKGGAYTLNPFVSELLYNVTEYIPAAISRSRTKVYNACQAHKYLRV